MDFSTLPPTTLAIAIFLARILDVSLGTLRTIVVIRGYPMVAAIVGFFEILLWLAAAGQVFRNLDAWYLAFAYAGGFATGNMVGMWLESRLAIGWQLVRIVSTDPAVQLADRLRQSGYDVINLPGRGAADAPVEVLLVADQRRRIRRLVRLVRELDPEAFWTTNDVRRRPDETLRRRGVWSRPEWLRIIKKK
jgi:uncharacterized protein YebE (UPF0316 family)